MPPERERTEADFYADPVVYDVLHTSGTAREVDGLEKIALTFGSASADKDGPVWLEPACGTGRYLRLAAKRGCRVIGVDASEAMIEYATSRVERMGLENRCRFVVGDMEAIGDSVRAGSVDFAFCPINSIRHIETDAGMRRHLKGVRAALKAGGVYAVGLSTSRWEWESPSEDVWEGRRGNLHVRQVAQYIPPTGGLGRFEEVINHMTITRGARVSSVDSVFRLRTFRIEEWRAVVRAAGLEIVATVDEDGIEWDAPECGYAVWVLRVRG